MNDLFASIEKLKQNIDSTNEKINWIDANKYYVLFGVFVAVVIACVVANQITK